MCSVLRIRHIAFRMRKYAHPHHHEIGYRRKKTTLARCALIVFIFGLSNVCRHQYSHSITAFVLQLSAANIGRVKPDIFCARERGAYVRTTRAGCPSCLARQHSATKWGQLHVCFVGRHSTPHRSYDERVCQHCAARPKFTISN